MKKPDEKELRLLKREPEPELPPPPSPVMDAAESRWDPWLIALAKMEVMEEAPRLN